MCCRNMLFIKFTVTYAHKAYIHAGIVDLNISGLMEIYTKLCGGCEQILEMLIFLIVVE